VNARDRVAVSDRTELVGTIHEIKRGIAEVHLDGGGKGYFKISDLMPAAEAPASDRTWPPSNLETKMLPG
jgi:hypothetical protein